jgi:hypothetical protein
MKERRETPETDEDLAQAIWGYGPCTGLLLSLLALILLYPYFQEGTLARVSLAILFLLVLLGGAFSIRRSRLALILKAAFGVLGVALEWTAIWKQNTAMLALAGLPYAAFLVIPSAKYLITS